MVFWIWLQLLSFNLANQTLDPAEDRINKKSRPLPAGRISRRTAIILRWILPFVNLAWSARYSKEVFMSCLAGAVFTLLYNEAGLAAGHWVGRNVVIGFGQSSFEVGACLIAGESHGTPSRNLLAHKGPQRSFNPFIGQHCDLFDYL